MSARDPGSANRLFARLTLTGAAVLTFDQVMFFAGLHRTHRRAGLAVLVGGWVAKMGAVALYSVLCTVYLRWCRAGAAAARAPRHCRRVRRAHLSRTLRRLAGAYRPRCADRRARSRPARGAGPPDDRRGRACRPAGEPAAGRHRSLQELQRPLRPRRWRRRAQAYRRRHHVRGACGRPGVPLRRRRVRRDLRWHECHGGAGARRAHPPRGRHQRRQQSAS